MDEIPITDIPTVTDADEATAIEAEPIAEQVRVNITAERHGDRFKVTATHNGEIVNVDTINPDSAIARRRFIKAVTAKLDGLDGNALERELLNLPVTVPMESATDNEAEPEAVPMLVKVSVTLDGNGIIRADLDGETVHLDRLDVRNAQHRKRFIKGIVDKVPELDVADAELQLISIAETVVFESAKSNTPTVETSERPLDSMPADIVDEARTMLESPHLLRQIVDDLGAMDIAGERELATTVYLVGTSRLLPRPLAARVHGPSSSGKSFLIDRVASLFPAESVIYATQMTPQALFHMPAGRLEHRWIVAGERSRVEDDERAEATRALREMISAGKLVKLMPMKVEGNKLETVAIEQEGPIAFTESTTLSKVFDEDANRCISLHTDERPDQSRRIIRKLAASHVAATGTTDRERIIQRHHAAQRLLNRVPVVVPFAERLAELMPADKVEVRRAFPHLISTIQAVALLHQFQRGRDANGAVVATVDDYQIVERLLRAPMDHLLGNALSEPARRFGERLREWFKHDFTTSDVKKKREVGSKSSVAGWLAELHEAGVLDLIEEGRGKKPHIWRVSSQAEQITCGVLPTVVQVFSESAWTHGHKPETVTA